MAESSNDWKSLQRSGVYVPPFKQRQALAALKKNKSLKVDENESYQRLKWDALRKRINACVNKVTRHNLTSIAVELLSVNVLRGRGLVCRALMKAQVSSPQYSAVYCSLVSVLNSKLPMIGELLCQRLINALIRAFKRSDKQTLTRVITFLGYLTNFGVLHELVVLQAVMLLLKQATTGASEDALHVAKELVLVCGQTLRSLAPKVMVGIFEQLRDILQQQRHNVGVKTQYELEHLMDAFRHDFKDNPPIPFCDELDLIDDCDVVTHRLSISEEYDSQKLLDVFRFDDNWTAHDCEYKRIRSEILGTDETEISSDEDDDNDEEEDDDDSDSSVDKVKDDSDVDTDSDDDSNENDSSEDVEMEAKGEVRGTGDGEAVDMTKASEMKLRREIYLTFMSSLTAEEMAHKVLKNFEGNEKQVARMVLEACAHERGYRSQYALLASRLCKVTSKMHSYEDCFDELFARQYNELHLYDANKIRNVARFFAYLFVTDALDWTAMEFMKLTQSDTNPSKRIFIKVLFQELASFLGAKLYERLFGELRPREFDEALKGLFPCENPKHIRFSINFFTTIGLGSLTDKMRKQLQEFQEMLQKQQEMMESSDDDEADDGADDDDSDSDSSDSDSSDSDSSSDSSSTSSSSSSSPSRRRPPAGGRLAPRKRASPVALPPLERSGSAAAKRPAVVDSKKKTYSRTSARVVDSAAAHNRRLDTERKDKERFDARAPRGRRPLSRSRSRSKSGSNPRSNANAIRSQRGFGQQMRGNGYRQRDGRRLSARSREFERRRPRSGFRSRSGARRRRRSFSRSRSRSGSLGRSGDGRAKDREERRRYTSDEDDSEFETAAVARRRRAIKARARECKRQRQERRRKRELAMRDIAKASLKKATEESSPMRSAATRAPMATTTTAALERTTEAVAEERGVKRAVHSKVHSRASDRRQRDGRRSGQRKRSLSRSVSRSYSRSRSRSGSRRRSQTRRRREAGSGRRH